VAASSVVLLHHLAIALGITVLRHQQERRGERCHDVEQEVHQDER